MNKFIEVEIRKPLFDNFCYIRNTYINKAIREKKSLRISIPQGVCIITPGDWLKGAKRLEQVFKRPDEPMILYGNYVPVKKEEVVAEKPKEAQLALF